MEERVISPKLKDEDAAIDVSLRPKRLDDYVGQDKVKQNLKISIQAAKARHEALDHVLLYGPPGLGKTTLANIISTEMEVKIKITSGPAILIPGDLASMLTSLQQGDILFIDEIHRLSKVVEEAMYPAMEDFAWDMVLGKGMAAKSIRLKLPRFTIIGATTRYALLSSPLRDRFGSTYRLDFYDHNNLEKIVQRAAHILGVKLREEGAAEIARRSRGTPRIANRLLKRVRDFAEVKAEGIITKAVAQDALGLLEIDDLGLDDIDRRVLLAIVDKFNGGPVGIETIAAAISEEADTIMDVYEPFLLQLGFIARTPRGRIATKLAYSHLGRYKPEEPGEEEHSKQPTLW
jgi:Holliday junction DNA helicase RuvB